MSINKNPFIEDILSGVAAQQLPQHRTQKELLEKATMLQNHGISDGARQFGKRLLEWYGKMNTFTKEQIVNLETLFEASNLSLDDVLNEGIGRGDTVTDKAGNVFRVVHNNGNGTLQVSQQIGYNHYSRPAIIAESAVRKLEEKNKRSASNSSFGYMNEETLVRVYDRVFSAKKFKSDKEANDFMEKNSDWGTIGTKGNDVYVAKMKDKGKKASQADPNNRALKLESKEFLEEKARTFGSYNDNVSSHKFGKMWEKHYSKYLVSVEYAKSGVIGLFKFPSDDDAYEILDYISEGGRFGYGYSRSQMDNLKKFNKDRTLTIQINKEPPNMFEVIITNTKMRLESVGLNEVSKKFIESL